MLKQGHPQVAEAHGQACTRADAPIAALGVKCLSFCFPIREMVIIYCKLS